MQQENYKIMKQRENEKRKIQEAIYLSKKEEVKQTKAIKGAFAHRRADY